MNGIKNYKNVYFLGIGGIGMSALAKWFCMNGYRVWGYDKTLSPITDQLESCGVKITDVDSVDHLPKPIAEEPSASLIIYTPAIPRGSVMLGYFKAQNYGIAKRSEVLGMITKDYFTVGVAGTHGKTTTSSVLVHLLKEGGKNVLGFLGGLSKNYNSNLVYDPTDQSEPIVVVEADEYDRSFLQLHPNAAIVTALDADHLDIYDDEEDFANTFKAFVELIAEDGLLVKSSSVWKNLIKDRTDIREVLYGCEGGDAIAESIHSKDGVQYFDYVVEGLRIPNIEVILPGKHNIDNCLAAISVAIDLGVDPKEIPAILKSYSGVKRRFEYVIKNKDVVFIDDYAHHPSELTAFVQSARSLYPDKKLTVAFQPHLYSRTRDFMGGFAEVLSQVDELLLLDIYPARELPIPGITSEVLLEKIPLENKSLVTKDELVEIIGRKQVEVFATLGAGDIDRLVQPVANQLNK